jgi:hypothetical protein
MAACRGQGYRICRICSLPLDGGGPEGGCIPAALERTTRGTITPSQPSPIEGEGFSAIGLPQSGDPLELR